MQKNWLRNNEANNKLIQVRLAEEVHIGLVKLISEAELGNKQTNKHTAVFIELLPQLNKNKLLKIVLIIDYCLIQV